MADTSNPAYGGQHNFEEDIISVKAIAVSEGSKLFVSLVGEEALTPPHGVRSIKEILMFFGDYENKNEGTDLTDHDKYECEHSTRFR